MPPFRQLPMGRRTSLGSSSLTEGGNNLVIGVMDLRAMAVVAAAITIERLAPASERVVRAIGAVVVGTGLFLIARGYPLDRNLTPSATSTRQLGEPGAP